VRRERLGKCAVADKEAGLDVSVERRWGELGGRDEELLVVVDDGLGMEDRPGAITRVDGTWAVVDVI
jgi:hypothetical protein